MSIQAKVSQFQLCTLSTYKYYYNSQSDSKVFPIYLNYKKENKALSLLDRIFFQKGLCFPTEDRIRQNWTKLDWKRVIFVSIKIFEMGWNDFSIQ